MKRISGWRVLIRAVARTFPTGATLLAVSGLLLAAPTAAHASGGGLHICAVPEVDDCIDAPNLDPFTHVVGGSPGRDLIVQPVPGGVELIFVLHDETMCVAAEDNRVKVDVKVCYGSDGVVWHLSDDPKNSSLFRFESQEFAGYYLSGTGNGSDFILLSGTPIQDFEYPPGG